jgi:hypothetical protein
MGHGLLPWAGLGGVKIVRDGGGLDIFPSSHTLSIKDFPSQGASRQGLAARHLMSCYTFARGAHRSLACGLLSRSGGKKDLPSSLASSNVSFSSHQILERDLKLTEHVFS